MRAIEHTARAARPRGLALVCLTGLLGACPKDHVRGSEETGASGTTATGTDEPTPTSGPGATGVVTGSTGGASTGTSTGGASSTGVAGTTGSESSTGDASSSSGSSGEASTGSTSGTSTGGGTTGEPAQLFECFGCTCDANVSFCRQVFAGFAAPDDPLCPIVDPEGKESGCVIFPVDCSEPPSCECLPTMNKNCFCNELAPGQFEVTCPLP